MPITAIVNPILPGFNPDPSFVRVGENFYIARYDTKTHYYLRVTHDATLGRTLGIVLTDDGTYHELTDSQITVTDWPLVYLRADLDGARLQFSAAPDGTRRQEVGPVLDASKLSDDYGHGLHFTGAFVGLCAQDVGGTRVLADFDYFALRNHA